MFLKVALLAGRHNITHCMGAPFTDGCQMIHGQLAWLDATIDTAMFIMGLYRFPLGCRQVILWGSSFAGTATRFNDEAFFKMLFGIGAGLLLICLDIGLIPGLASLLFIGCMGGVIGSIVGRNMQPIIGFPCFGSLATTDKTLAVKAVFTAVARAFWKVVKRSRQYRFALGTLLCRDFWRILCVRHAVLLARAVMFRREGVIPVTPSLCYCTGF